MMPKASLNCWIAEWEKESKMFAFLGMMRLGIEGPVLQQAATLLFLHGPEPTVLKP
jgi:hypothetical protein